MEALESVWEANREVQRERLAQGVAKAVEKLLALLDAKNPNVVLKAACAILDRAGIFPAAAAEAKVGLSPELQGLLEEAMKRIR